MSPIEQLDKLCETLDNNFTNLARGGCGVVAACLAEEMSRFLPVRVRVADRFSTWNTIDEARRGVKNNSPTEWADNGVGLGHLFVEFAYNGQLYHMDALNIHEAFYDNTDPSLGMEVTEGALTIVEAIEMASYSKGWNPQFDRRQIPAIQRTIRNFFKNDFTIQ
jgi:hypothetical protein